MQLGRFHNYNYTRLSTCDFGHQYGIAEGILQMLSGAEKGSCICKLKILKDPSIRNATYSFVERLSSKESNQMVFRECREPKGLLNLSEALMSPLSIN